MACFKTDAHSHPLKWTYRERHVGLYATWAFLWFGFPAPTSSIDLNLNSDNTCKVTPMIELLLKKAFLIRNVFWVPGGWARGIKNICARENRMKPLENTISWYQTYPHIFPPTGVCFSSEATKNIINDRCSTRTINRHNLQAKYYTNILMKLWLKTWL